MLRYHRRYPTIQLEAFILNSEGDDGAQGRKYGRARTVSFRSAAPEQRFGAVQRDALGKTETGPGRFAS